MESLDRALREAEGRIGIPAGEPYSAEYGRMHLRQARSQFRTLEALLRKATRAESDLVLGACMDALEGKSDAFGSRAYGQPRA
jgi:hypothetical protein